MAQCIKCQQRVSASEQSSTSSAASVTVTSEDSLSPAYRQPAMQRHIHPIPPKDTSGVRHPDQQTALLRALEQQNALLTDLLSAVNGLAALICSRNHS